MSDHGICQRRSFCCFRSPRSCLHRCDPAEKTWWLVLSRSVVSDSPQPRGLQPARLLCPWNPPGQYTGVSSRSLLQGIFPAQGLNPRLLHYRQILYHGATWEVQEARILTSFCTQAPAAPRTSCYCWRLRVTPRQGPSTGLGSPKASGDRGQGPSRSASAADMCPRVGSQLQVPQWGLRSQAEPQTPTDVRETVDRLPAPAVATGCRFCLRPALSPPGCSLPLGAESLLPTWSES